MLIAAAIDTSNGFEGGPHKAVVATGAVSAGRSSDTVAHIAGLAHLTRLEDAVASGASARTVVEARADQGAAGCTVNRPCGLRIGREKLGNTVQAIKGKGSLAEILAKDRREKFADKSQGEDETKKKSVAQQPAWHDQVVPWSGEARIHDWRLKEEPFRGTITWI